jgi:MFS family permease
VKLGLGVLRRATGFRLLFLSTLASSMGTLLAAVALAIDVKDRTGSGIWVSALMIVEFLPAIAIGLALGPLVDRLSRRGLMVGADLARVAVFTALAFVSSPSAIVAMAAVAGVATGFFRPAVYAGLPNLVADEELAQANSVLQGVENLSWAIGPLLGGVIVAVSGPHLAYWINAVSFLVSALLIARIPGRLLQTATALTKGHWSDVKEGLGAVVRSRPLVTVVVAWSLVMIGNAAVNVGDVFIAKDTFHAGDFGFGVLYGASGVGLVLGSFAAALLESRARVSLLYGGGIGAMALGIGAAAVSPNVWVASALCIVSGTGNGIAGVCNALLVQRGAPDNVRGRAFTVVMSVNYVVLGLAMAGAGPFIDAFGARWAWGLAGLVLAAAALIGLVLARGIGVEPPLARVTPMEPLGVPEVEAETRTQAL